MDPFFLKIWSSQTNVSNAIFDRRSPQPTEWRYFLAHHSPILGVYYSRVLKILRRKKTDPLFFWKFGHSRPILGTQSLTRGLYNLRKWVFVDGAHKHTWTWVNAKIIKIEQNSYLAHPGAVRLFLSIQSSNRGHLALLLSWQSLKATTARPPLLVHCMLRN